MLMFSERYGSLRREISPVSTEYPSQKFPDLESCISCICVSSAAWYSMFFITDASDFFGLPSKRGLGKSFLKKTLLGVYYEVI